MDAQLPMPRLRLTHALDRILLEGTPWDIVLRLIPYGACLIVSFVVGMAILAGARFARWFWLAVAAGVTFAVAFVLWLIGQSIFSLGTLCPWCMVTWVVTIPTFYAVWVQLLRSGVVSSSPRVKAAGNALAAWVPLMAFVTYAVVALIAQLRLDVLGALF